MKVLLLREIPTSIITIDNAIIAANTIKRSWLPPVTGSTAASFGLGTGAKFSPAPTRGKVSDTGTAVADNSGTAVMTAAGISTVVVAVAGTDGAVALAAVPVVVTTGVLVEATTVPVVWVVAVAATAVLVAWGVFVATTTVFVASRVLVGDTVVFEA